MAVLRVVLASNNVKKLKELQALMGDLPVELAVQSSLGVAEAEEPYATFLENALAKARHAARATGHAAMADDSGLCVPALGGAPGVDSAHYAGQVEPCTDREATRRRQDAANNRVLLERMAHLTGPGQRAGRFVCTLVAVRAADDPEPLAATGRWEGELLGTCRGTHGFGYDPLLYIPAAGCTVAELTPERKNLISHRALAARQMVRLMQEAWAL